MSPFLLAVFLLSQVLAAAGVPTWWGWMADMVPPRIRGRYWAARQQILLMVQMPCALFALLVTGPEHDHDARSSDSQGTTTTGGDGIADPAVVFAVHRPLISGPGLCRSPRPR